MVDFDPESIDNHASDEESIDQSDDEDSQSADENAGREHYVSVRLVFSKFTWWGNLKLRCLPLRSKSKLRKNQDLHLDPKYDGARISRDVLGNDFDDRMDDDMNESLDDLSESADDDDDAVDSEPSLHEEESSDSGGVRLPDTGSRKSNGVNKNDLRIKAKRLEASDEELEGDSGDEDDEEDDDDDSDMSGLEDESDDSAYSDEDMDEREGEEATRRAELRKMMADEQK